MSAGTVGKSPYDSEAVRRMIYEPDWKTLENISEQAKDMLEKRDYEGVGRLCAGMENRKMPCPVSPFTCTKLI